MSHHHPDPETVEISAKEFTELEARISASNLSDADGQLIIKALNFMSWLQRSLEHAKLSIKKLQRLLLIGFHEMICVLRCGYNVLEVPRGVI